MSFPGSIANRKRRAEEAALRNARASAANVQAPSRGDNDFDRPNNYNQVPKIRGSAQTYFDDEPTIQKRRISNRRQSRYDSPQNYDDEEEDYLPRRRHDVRDVPEEPYEPRDPRDPRDPRGSRSTPSRRERVPPTTDVIRNDENRFPAHRRGPSRSTRPAPFQEVPEETETWKIGRPSVKEEVAEQPSYQSRSRVPPSAADGRSRFPISTQTAPAVETSTPEIARSRKPGVTRVVVVTPCFPCTLTRSMPSERIEEYEKLALEHSRNEERESPIGARLMVTSTPVTTSSGLTQMSEDERRNLIFAWIAVADRIALYTDLGVTPFMSDVIQMATREKRDLDFRLLGDTWARARTNIPTSVMKSSQTPPLNSSSGVPSRQSATRNLSVQSGREENEGTSTEEESNAKDDDNVVLDVHEEKDTPAPEDAIVDMKEIHQESPENEGPTVSKSRARATKRWPTSSVRAQNKTTKKAA